MNFRIHDLFSSQLWIFIWVINFHLSIIFISYKFSFLKYSLRNLVIKISLKSVRSSIWSKIFIQSMNLIWFNEFSSEWWILISLMHFIHMIDFLFQSKNILSWINFYLEDELASNLWIFVAVMTFITLIILFLIMTFKIVSNLHLTVKFSSQLIKPYRSIDFCSFNESLYPEKL